MGNSVNLILDQALELSATERATVAEKLLFSQNILRTASAPIVSNIR